MTNIWTPGGGRVVALAPGPGDLFVLTTVASRKVLLHPVEQFGHVVKLAEAAAIRMAPVPKLLCTWAQARGEKPSRSLPRLSKLTVAGWSGQMRTLAQSWFFVPPICCCDLSPLRTSVVAAAYFFFLVGAAAFLPAALDGAALALRALLSLGSLRF